MPTGDTEQWQHGNPKSILILGDGPTDGLNDTTITAKAKYFLLSLIQER